MPSNSTSFDAAGIPDYAGVIISSYVQETSPVLRLLVVYVALGATCFPLLLAVLYFSTPRIRRTPLFMMVVFDILLGIAISCWMVTETLTFLLNPLPGYPRTTFIVIPIVTLLSPWIIDLVLLLRLYAVFPFATTPRRIFCAVFAFAACVKVARLGCGIANTVLWVPTVPQDPALYSASNIRAVHGPLLKAMSTFDLVDHIFVAACFLWKIRDVSFGLKYRGARPRNAGINAISLAHRLRMVFYIALGNFVIPGIFNVLLLLAIYIDSINATVILYLQPMNAYINIFGIVFATVWSSGHPPAGHSSTCINAHPVQYPLQAYHINRTLTMDVTDVEGMKNISE